MVISAEIRWTFQIEAGWILCNMSHRIETDTKTILSHLNRSDSCQIIAYIWQLHRSPQEIERETRTIWDNFFLWHPISLSNRDRNPPSLRLCVADSFCGHFLWFSGKRILLESGEDRGSLEDEEPPTVCQWKPVELTPHFAPKKVYFQWVLCIPNEMHIFLRCGCRHVS